MASNVMLIQAASGLEKLMLGANSNGIIKDSNVAQISALLYYEANVIAKLSDNSKFKKLFVDTIFNQINQDFGAYIDAQARSKPKSLHHVYEWKKVGLKSARLFQLNKQENLSSGVSFKLDFTFLPSKSTVPSSTSKRKHVFIEKAAVMEKGEPLVIFPKYAQRLVFKSDGEFVFMPKGYPVTVKRPGGKYVKNQFTLLYSRWFSGQLVNESIKKSGFQNIFATASAKALKIPTSIKKVQYKFSPNAIKNMAEAAAVNAYGGVLV